MEFQQELGTSGSIRYEPEPGPSGWEMESEVQDEENKLLHYLLLQWGE